jgi:O-antigen/teichoic acid export membrane protein
MSNNTQIAKNIFYNFLSFGVNLLINLLLTPYLVRTVGKEAYGFVPLINSILDYTSIITAAVGSLAGRFITMAYYQNDKEGTEGYFNSVIIAYMGLSAIFGVMGFIFVLYLDQILTIPIHLLVQVRWLFVIALLSMILSLCTQFFGIGTFVKNRLDLQSLFSLITNIVRVALIVLLFCLLKPSIVFISLSSFLAGVLGVYFTIYLKKKLLPEIVFHPKRYFSWSKVKTLTASGIWMSLNQLSNILTTSIDLFLSNIFVGAAITGDFAISKTVPALIGSVSGLVGGSFYAEFNILYAKSENELLLHEIKKSIKLMTYILAVPIGYFFVNTDYFFKLWVPSAYSPLMYWLSVISLVASITGVGTNPIFGIFNVTNKRRLPALVLLGIGVVNVVIVYILFKTTLSSVLVIPLVSGILLSLRNIFFTPIYGAMCLNIKKWSFYPVYFKSIMAIFVVVLIGFLSRTLMVNLTWMTFIANISLVTVLSYFVNFFIVLNTEERKYIYIRIREQKEKVFRRWI